MRARSSCMFYTCDKIVIKSSSALVSSASVNMQCDLQMSLKNDCWTFVIKTFTCRRVFCKHNGISKITILFRIINRSNAMIVILLNSSRMIYVNNYKENVSARLSVRTKIASGIFALLIIVYHECTRASKLVSNNSRPIGH